MPPTKEMSFCSLFGQAAKTRNDFVIVRKRAHKYSITFDDYAKRKTIVLKGGGGTAGNARERNPHRGRPRGGSNFRNEERVRAPWLPGFTK